MLTKDLVKNVKNEGATAITKLLSDYTDAKSIAFILENLGHLPSELDGDFLLDYAAHKNTTVRVWAIKTIGKLKDEKYLSVLQKIGCEDTDTTVRREAVSSIGRLRTEQGKEVLKKFLTDNDPKVVCQAIRGLVVFKGDEDVDSQMSPLVNHVNETVRTIIYKEYHAKKTDCNKQPHSESDDRLRNLAVNGDTIEVMKNIDDESIHLTFTSPPYYNARDYSIYPSYEHYLQFLADVFEQVHRITKEGRFLIVNTSPVIVPRISRSHSSKRYPIPFDIHPYLMKMGWEFIDDIIWLKPEASVKNRIGGFMQHRKPLGYKPNCVTEYLMVYRKSTEKLLDWNIKQYSQSTIDDSKVLGAYESTNVWKIDPSFSKVHSAVFPAELCKRVIEYYSYKGDLVFDPFGGSGTLGKTAKKMDRYYLLTEQDKTYFEFIKANISNDLFNDTESKFLTLNEFEKAMK